MRRWWFLPCLGLVSCLFTREVRAAESEHHLGWQLGSVQIDESLHGGLVFTGFQTAFSYRYARTADTTVFRYRPQFGGGLFFNRGMMGFGVDVRPIDAFLGFRVVNRDYQMFIGPQLWLDYRLQLYPDLQMGHSFWNTTAGLGPAVLLKLPHHHNRIHIGLEYTVLGAVSRPQSRIPPYFYSLGFTDVVSKLHSDFAFATIHQLARGALEVDYVFDRKAHDVMLGYRFDLIGVFDAPRFTYFAHSFHVRYQL